MQPQLLLASHSPREFKISPRLQKQPSFLHELQDPEGLTHVLSQPHDLYSFPFLSQYSSKIKKQNRDATSSKKLFSEQTLMWGTRRRESQKARADGTSKKKKCHKEKKTGKKEKGNLCGQLHLMRCFVYMLSEGYVFTACMGTFFSFLSFPPPKIWGSASEGSARFSFHTRFRRSLKRE